ncbi:hypothetical protein [Actinomadura nitritigenes]|uniref:hypothetical protein n=1 Tax=Actinomadura nitritigenes TaxID=134602 RepID=UPI003D915DB5
MRLPSRSLGIPAAGRATRVDVAAKPVGESDLVDTDQNDSNKAQRDVSKTDRAGSWLTCDVSVNN